MRLPERPPPRTDPRSGEIPGRSPIRHRIGSTTELAGGGVRRPAPNAAADAINKSNASGREMSMAPLCERRAAIVCALPNNGRACRCARPFALDSGACMSAFAHRAGNSTVNWLPNPSPALVACTLPPCASTRSRTTASPMPLATFSARIARVGLCEQLEYPFQHRGRNADARVAKADAGVVADALHGERDVPAVGCVLGGIDQQVREHLLEARDVGVHPKRIGGQTHHQAVPVARHIRRDRIDREFHDGSQIHVRQAQRLLAPGPATHRAIPRCAGSSGRHGVR